MGLAGPPIDPPADTRVECEACDAQGVIWAGADGVVAEVECPDCDGDGLVERGDDPYAPDTWKEAEGLA